MRILFIAGQSIKSNSSVTMMNLAYIRGLVEVGCEVKIITSKLPSNHIAYDTDLNLPKEVLIDEYNISSAFNLLSNKKAGRSIKEHCISYLKRLLRGIFYKFSIYDSQKSWVNNVHKVKQDDNFYDIIISSSDPKHSHLFAEKLIESKKVIYGKWIQLWGDPMYLDITRKGMIFKRRLLREEERLINAADKIIYVSPFTAMEQKKLFPKQANKIDFVLIPYFKKDESLPRLIPGEKLVFGYYGDYNSGVRNLNPLYNAAKETALYLVIRGNSDKPLAGTANIDISNRITIKELEILEQKTDIFIHLCNSKGTQIPAKVYYYSGTKKPILFILDGEGEKIRQFFEPYGRYIFCNNNKEEIIETINRIILKGFSDQETRIVDELSPYSIAKDLLKKSGVMTY